MAIDETFVKPGAVPFKWEIKPGVPKFQTHHCQQQQQQNQSLSSPLPQPPLKSNSSNYLHTLSSPPFPSPRKLTPPPSWSPLFSTPGTHTRARSFRSSVRTSSERWRLGRSSSLIRSENVSSPGCFPSALLRRRKQGRVNSSSKRMNYTTGQVLESDHTCDIETLTRLSVSSRRSLLSPSSSFSSYQSSPRSLNDVEWAGFGLF